MMKLWNFGRKRPEVAFTVLSRGAVEGGIVCPDPKNRPLVAVLECNGERLCEAKLFAESDDWDLCRFRLPLPRLALKQGTRLRVSVDCGALGTPSTELVLQRSEDDAAFKAAVDRKLNGIHLRGWAVGALAAECEYALYVDDVYRSGVRLSATRADIAEQFGGTGANGFSIEVPEDCFDGKNHRLAVVAEPHGYLLINSPLALSRAALLEALKEEIRKTEGR